MIFAKDARRQAVEVVTAHQTEELSKVDKLIREAISKGRFECYYNGHISKIAKEELVGFGYSVETGSQYNEYYTTIKW